MSGDHKGGANSAIIIARILGTEGYSIHVHNEVKRWWKRTVMDQRRAKKIARLEREFGEFMKDASEADRLLVGRFIALRAQQSFEAGFRIGFQGFVHEQTKGNGSFGDREKP